MMRDRIEEDDVSFEVFASIFFVSSCLVEILDDMSMQAHVSVGRMWRNAGMGVRGAAFERDQPHVYFNIY